MNSSKPEATYRLADLSRIEIQENLRYAYDSGYSITILAPELTPEWAYEAEQWLVNNGLPYSRLLISND